LSFLAKIALNPTQHVFDLIEIEYDFDHWNGGWKGFF